MIKPSLFTIDVPVRMRRYVTHASNVTPYNNTRRHTQAILNNRISDGLWRKFSYVTEISDGMLCCLIDVLRPWHIEYAISHTKSNHQIRNMTIRNLNRRSVTHTDI